METKPENGEEIILGSYGDDDVDEALDRLFQFHL
jgi:hypothetical protein